MHSSSAGLVVAVRSQCGPRTLNYPRSRNSHGGCVKESVEPLKLMRETRNIVSWCRRRSDCVCLPWMVTVPVNSTSANVGNRTVEFTKNHCQVRGPSMVARQGRDHLSTCVVVIMYTQALRCSRLECRSKSPAAVEQSGLSRWIMYFGD